MPTTAGGPDARVRTTGHLAFVVATFGPRRGRRLFATNHPAPQLLRSLLLLASTALSFAALRFVSLATAASGLAVAYPGRRGR